MIGIAVHLHTCQRVMVIGLGVLLWALGEGQGRAGADDSVKFSREQVEFYEKQVEPILEENCYNCHSHQADKIKGGFVLDSREGLLKGGDDGAAVVAGEPEKSLLIKAVRHEDEDLKMPPKKKLTEGQIATLAAWIKMGAPYAEARVAKPIQAKAKKITEEDRKWWSFQPVREAKLSRR